MGVFSARKYNDSYERLIAKSVKLCRVVDIRELEGKPSEDGAPVRSTTFITFGLAEPAKTPEGEVLEPGFQKDVGFGYCDDPQGDEKMETLNRISNERVRELVVHALGLPLDCKDASKELDARGGPDALKNCEVGVMWSVRNNRQNVDGFVAAAACKKA